MPGNRSSGLGVKGGGTVKSTSALPDLSNPNFALPFFAYLPTPINTPAASPIEYEMLLPIGVVRRIWVEMPSGCAGLVGIRVFRGIYQIFPLPDGTWYRSNGSVVNFAFTHEITNEPYALTIKTYNLDDTYPHTPWVGFEMTGRQGEISPTLAGLIDLVR